MNINPMQMIMQFMQGGKGNPQQIIQQIMQGNPQANAVMQQVKQSGMSNEEFARQTILHISTIRM